MQYKRALALITLPLTIGTTLWVEASINSAEAQIVPDNTLGAESSVVTPDTIKGIPSARIDGGATRGTNLFHSFLEFNVGEGQGAYFSNPATIENILSRVTGSNLSQILGTLGVLGDANLFFINPNGIVFGPNARLDVGGSFFASTADSLVFENGFEFSSTDPQAPPLLEINIPIGLNFRDNPGDIVNQSVATNNMGESVGLQVQPESTLALVGGDVAIESGRLTALDGQIELGSVAGNNLVSLKPTETGYALGYEGIENFQTIRLSQGAFVNTSGNSGGRIQVQGSNVTLSDESFMFADTEGSGNGGGISLKASQLTLLGGSLITADVLGSGQGGDVTIETGQLTVRDGAQVRASNFDEGAGGNLMVNASESVELIGTSADGQFPSGLLTETSGAGDAGDLTLTTGRLLVADGGQVSAGIFFGQGSGDGGNLTVNATESVELIGTSADGQFSSGLFSATGGTGNAGDLRLNTGRLLVADGAEVSASTFGSGAGGNLTVNATESVQVIGTLADGFPSGLSAQAALGSTGNAGSLTISTPTLLIQDGAQVDTITFGPGDGGNLTISTPTLLIQDGAQVSASTFASGAGGNLTVNATESVQVIGTSADGEFPSGLFVGTEGAGDAGDLTISTPTLLIQDGAQVIANTSGEGNAGNILVQADSVEVTGADSFLSAEVREGATGRGGELRLETEQLNVRDQAQVTVSTAGSSRAGNLTIETGQLLVSDGAQISAGTSGAGDGGNLTIRARQGVELRGTGSETFDEAIEESLRIGAASGDLQELLTTASLSTATVSTGGAGTITIDTPSLVLRDGAIISSTTFGEGEAGRIVINNAELVELRGSGLVAGTFNPDAAAPGGNIQIDTGKLSLQEGGIILTTTFGQGAGGNVDVRASESVELGSTPSGVILPTTINASSVFSTGPAGNIRIETPKLIVRDGAQIVTNSGSDSLPEIIIQQGGSGGNIDVRASESVEVSGSSPDGRFGSALTAESFSDSPAGDLSIETGQMTISDGAQVTVSSPQGQAGNLRIAADSLSLDRGSITAETGKSEGEVGANITLQLSDLLILSNESLISAQAFNTADGGNINIDTKFLIAFPPQGPDGSDIIAKASEGLGGKIIITAQGIFGIEPRPAIPGNRTNDIDAGEQVGLTGTVTIRSPGVKPDRGLVELPEDIVDPAALIAQNPCSLGNEGSEFVITGRGGLPPSPSQLLGIEESGDGWIELLPTVDNTENEKRNKTEDSTSQNLSPQAAPENETKIRNPIVPARGWIFNEKGEAVLVAYDPTKTGAQRFRRAPASCPF